MLSRTKLFYPVLHHFIPLAAPLAAGRAAPAAAPAAPGGTLPVSVAGGLILSRTK